MLVSLYIISSHVSWIGYFYIRSWVEKVWELCDWRLPLTPRPMPTQRKRHVLPQQQISPQRTSTTWRKQLHSCSKILPNNKSWQRHIRNEVAWAATSMPLSQPWENTHIPYMKLVWYLLILTGLSEIQSDLNKQFHIHSKWHQGLGQHWNWPRKYVRHFYGATP